LTGFTLAEVGVGRQDQLWLRGGFPDSFLADDDAASWAWRENFIRTFLERDITQLGSQVPAATLRRFWTMLAHHHGQIWNGAEIGASLGVARRPPGATSICSSGRLWCASCRRGLRTRASAR
jgi:uncharacterized protein